MKDGRIGGVFEFHPKLRVGFLEAQNSWVPGLLSRFEWDYPHFDSNFPAQILRGGAHLYGFTEADFAKADEAAAAKD